MEVLIQTRSDFGLLTLSILGAMKLEATKFRPREVVKHVLQTAAASLQKILTLEGHVADDVPIEVKSNATLFVLLSLKIIHQVQIIEHLNDINVCI